MKNIITSILLLLIFINCSKPVARKPISKNSGTFIKESVTRNLELKKKEEVLIKNIIEKDTINKYIQSGNGFWYSYVAKDSLTKPKPIFGDVVNFDYNLKKLDGNTIYSKKELSNQTYAIDKEVYFYGLREGIKLLQEGESAVFIFPSQFAYGYYGDEKKIGSNVPLIAEITLNSINKQ